MDIVKSLLQNVCRANIREHYQTQYLKDTDTGCQLRQGLIADLPELLAAENAHITETNLRGNLLRHKAVVSG